MIFPQLKRLHSPDLERPNLPIDVSDCAVFVQAEIGADEPGYESFSFTAVTPAHLKREDCSRWGRGYLLVSSFSWEGVETFLSSLLTRAARESWSEVAAELNKELVWEFDNYRGA
jgi:hypothetical protein